MRLIIDKNGLIKVGYWHLLFNEQLTKNMRSILDLMETRVKKGDLEKRVSDDILGKDTSPLNTPITINEFFLEQVFNGYFEITETLNLIAVTPYMFRQFPRNIKEIGKQVYFRYHITSYYNLLYILLERTNKYCVWLLRKYKSTNGPEVIEAAINEMENFVPPFLLIKREERHSAIHKQHYDDSELSRASFYELIKLVPPKEKRTEMMYSWLEKQNTKKIRKKWVKEIEKTNYELLKYIDVFFKKLHPFIFLDNGTFIYPKNIKDMTTTDLTYVSSRK